MWRYKLCLGKIEWSLDAIASCPATSLLQEFEEIRIVALLSSLLASRKRPANLCLVRCRDPNQSMILLRPSSWHQAAHRSEAISEVQIQGGGYYLERIASKLDTQEGKVLYWGKIGKQQRIYLPTEDQPPELGSSELRVWISFDRLHRNSAIHAVYPEPRVEFSWNMFCQCSWCLHLPSQCTFKDVYTASDTWILQTSCCMQECLQKILGELPNKRQRTSEPPDGAEEPATREHDTNHERISLTEVTSTKSKLSRLLADGLTLSINND